MNKEVAERNIKIISGYILADLGEAILNAEISDTDTPTQVQKAILEAVLAMADKNRNEFIATQPQTGE